MIGIDDKKCKNAARKLDSASMPPGCYIDVPYKADGITPDFDDLFEALAKHEREAPALSAC